MMLRICELPKMKLSECLEACHKTFDSMLTVLLNPLVVCVVIWMLTRLRPNMQVFEHGSFYVDAFYMAFSNARKHHREQNPTADDHCLETLLAMPTPWQEDIVMQNAKELGYDEAWSKPWFKLKRKRPKRRIQFEHFQLEQQHTDPCPDSH